MPNTFFFHKTYSISEIPLRQYLLLRLILFMSNVKHICKEKEKNS